MRDLAEIADTSQLAVSVHEEDGLILLNFRYSCQGEGRWLWADSEGNPVYEIAEWFDSDRLLDHINRLHGAGVINTITANGAWLLICRHRYECAVRQKRAEEARKARESNFWERLKSLFV
jgi:hypothetical protein